MSTPSDSNLNRQPSILVTIDVEDWFQVENFKNCIAFDSWPKQALRVEQNIDRLLQTLDAARPRLSDSPSEAPRAIQATFFVLGWLAERLPGLVRRIARQGHEIASHGYGHHLNYRLSDQELNTDLRASKKILEDITGTPVAGYRAPTFSINNRILDRVKACGYRYDSSYNSAGLAKQEGRLDLPDSEAGTLDFDPEQLESLLAQDRQHGPRVLAVVPAHLFGLPAAMPCIAHIAGRFDIPVIEDAAQAMGAEIDGQFCGTLGEVGFFSLGRGKALTTLSGGIILTRDPDLARLILSELDRLSTPSRARQGMGLLQGLALSLFLKPGLFWLPKGLPFLKLGQTLYNPEFSMAAFSGVQAGLSRHWQQRLDTFQSIRADNVRFYNESFQPNFPGSNSLFPKIASWGSYLIRYPLHVVEPACRKKLLADSDASWLGRMPGYSGSINTIEQIRDVFQGQAFPGAEQTAKTLITLPVHPFVTAKDREQIAELVIQACRSETTPARAQQIH